MRCFWCSTNMEGGAEQPNPLYEPCRPCIIRMREGVTVVEVTEKFQIDGQVPLMLDVQKAIWPTGRWAVVDPEAVKKRLPGGDVEGRYIFVVPLVWDGLGLGRPDLGGEVP